LTLFPTHLTPSDRRYNALYPPVVRLTRRVTHTVQSQVVELVDFIKNAVWWPTCEYANDDDGYSPQGIRRMYGEILLKKDLKPSMALSTFSLEVFIARVHLGHELSDMGLFTVLRSTFPTVDPLYPVNRKFRPLQSVHAVILPSRNHNAACTWTQGEVVRATGFRTRRRAR
jgi:hypothetical protein